MRVQLPNGLTIEVSVIDYLFILEEEDMDLFYQECMADNLGIDIVNPFSRKNIQSLDIDEDEEEDI